MAALGFPQLFREPLLLTAYTDSWCKQRAVPVMVQGAPAVSAPQAWGLENGTFPIPHQRRSLVPFLSYKPLKIFNSIVSLLFLFLTGLFSSPGRLDCVSENAFDENPPEILLERISVPIRNKPPFSKASKQLFSSVTVICKMIF